MRRNFSIRTDTFFISKTKLLLFGSLAKFQYFCTL